MKGLTLSLLAMLTLSGFASAQADDEDRFQRPFYQSVQQFDLDGDGQLNEAEREALKASGLVPGPADAQVLERFDADGDGQLNQSEREAARKARPSCTGRGARGGAGRS